MGEHDLQVKGLLAFYSKTTPSKVYQQLVPISTPAAGERVRKAIVAKKKAMDCLKSTGEKSFSQMFNRPLSGFDTESYLAKLKTIDAAELARELSLTQIEYPCLLVQVGSTIAVYLLESEESWVVLDMSPHGTKWFNHVGMKLTGAKDYNELVQMVERGDANKLNITVRDTHVSGTDRTEDDFYNREWDDDMLIFAFGKLCGEANQGMYSNDDIAAAWAQAFCMNTAKMMVLYGVIHKVGSVLVGGTCISTPVIRECLEESFMHNSLPLPFQGAQVIKMTSLPNPAFLGALGMWMHNYECEQTEKQKWKDSDIL